MKMRRSYKEAIQINPGTTPVKLIPVLDESNSSTQRTQEILDTAAKIIVLASKRGPVKKHESEGDEYAA
jgi:hypothetical protein